MFWLLSSLLLAQEISLDLEEVELEQKRQENLVELWRNLDEREHLTVIYDLQRSGRYLSAEQRLNFLLEEQSSPFLLFEIARNTELQSNYAAALVLYEQLYNQNLEEALALDVAFRRALVLSDLGLHTEAISSLRELKKKYSLSKSDKIAVDLALGSSQLHAGKKRAGINRIQRSLDSLENPRQHSWLQARARYALSTVLLEEARRIEIYGAQQAKRLNSRLQKRANLILQAEKNITVIIQLDEPEYALQGVVDVADAMIVFYDAIVATPPPGKFNDQQSKLFRNGMKDRASLLEDKAFEYYSKGLRYAEQLDWPGPIRQELQAKKDVIAYDRKL
jgi:tetratricopeptide (TPR) repeat protein